MEVIHRVYTSLKNNDQMPKICILALAISAVATNFGAFVLFYCIGILCIAYLVFKYISMEHLKITSGYKYWQAIINNKKVFLFLLFLIALMLFTAIQTGMHSLFQIIKICLLIMIGYFYGKIENISQFKKLAGFLTMVFMPTVYLGIHQMLFGKNILDRYLVWWGDTLKQGTVSVFLQHIVFGHVLVILFLLNTFGIRNKYLRWYHDILIIVALYSTKCRSAWLVFFGICILLLIQKIRITKIKINRNNVKKFVVYLMPVCLGILILCSIPATRNAFHEIIYHFQRLSNSGSTNYRSSTFVMLIKERLSDINPIHWLFGSGYGSSKFYLKNLGISLGDNNYVVDNQWVTIFIELGLPCLLIFVYYYIHCFKTFWNAVNHKIEIFELIQLSNVMMLFVYEGFGYQVIAFFVFVSMGINLAIMENKSKMRLA